MPLEVLIVADGLPGSEGAACAAGGAEPVTPEGLSALHPLWAADMAALGCLREVAAPAPLGRCWTPAAETGAHAPTSGADAIAAPCRLVLCGPCRSTMDVARGLVEAGTLVPWSSVLTPMQTAGRGQLRREWVSRPGNMLATLVCPPAAGLWNDLRPLVLGYLFAEAMSELGPAVSVKWPNDLLCDDHKVAGMLIEERPGCILAGIGVNMAFAPAAEQMRADFKVSAGEFHPSNGALGPLGLWRALVNRVKTSYSSFLEAFSPNDFLTIFRSRLAWQGRRVLVREGANVRYEAVVKGVSAEGGLVLDHAGREVVLLAGDVIPV